MDHAANQDLSLSPLEPTPPSSKSPFPSKKVIGCVLILLLIATGLFVIYYDSTHPVPIAPQSIKEVSKIPTIAVIQTTDFLDWKVYTDTKNSLKFHYPNKWVAAAQQLTGSGYTQEITSPDGMYRLELIVRGNYNNQTGKPFPDITSYLNLGSLHVNTIMVDGQEAIQALPRAGSENENNIVFFSKDKATIIEINLTTMTKFNSDNVDNGKKLFNQILSTVKLSTTDGQTDTTSWKTFQSSSFMYSFKYPPLLALQTTADVGFTTGWESSFLVPKSNLQGGTSIRDVKIEINNIDKVWDWYGKEGINKYFDSLWTQPIEPESALSNKRQVKVENLTVDGHDAVETYEQDSFADARDHFFSRSITIKRDNNALVEIRTIVYDQKDRKELDRVLDDIIASFKFNPK